MKQLLIILLSLPLFINAQTKVFTIELVPNQEVAYSGNLSEGSILNDLSWAWNSNNACFVEN